MAVTDLAFIALLTPQEHWAVTWQHTAMGLEVERHLPSNCRSLGGHGILISPRSQAIIRMAEGSMP